jgi:hypothetical protein
MEKLGVWPLEPHLTLLYLSMRPSLTSLSEQSRDQLGGSMNGAGLW